MELSFLKIWSLVHRSICQWLLASYDCKFEVHTSFEENKVLLAFATAVTYHCNSKTILFVVLFSNGKEALYISLLIFSFLVTVF